MIIKTEEKTIKVLGDTWHIEIDHYKDSDSKITIYNEEDESHIVRSKELFEAKIIAKNIMEIIEFLENAKDN